MPETAQDRPNVVYLSRNGMLEPLGQSQVLAYLRGLSSRYQITLLSLEKPEDWVDKAAVARVQSDCAAYGIYWVPRRFHYRPKLIAPAWSFLAFAWMCFRLVRRNNVSLVHARSYLPAAAALIVSRITGTPFIFDMRALWPEELIAAGRLKRNSYLHRAILRAERACLKRAAGVVSLTHAAVEYLRRQYPAELAMQRIVVIPTCADLDRFVPAAQRPPTRIYGCVGTVLSGWFRIDWLAAFFRAVAAKDKDARFEIVSRDDPDEVRSALGNDEAFQARLTIYPSPAHLVHEAVQRHSAAVMFFTDGLSKLGSSPTRMGEALGCGLPVVTNQGVGDTAEIVQAQGIGALVEQPTPSDMAAAVEAIERLISEPGMAERCRRTAQEIFSLQGGTAAYAALYQDVTGSKETRRDSGGTR